MTSSPDSTAINSTTIAPRLGQWLEDYNEVATILPVLAGLLATSRLRLRGAQALLVNLLIAALVRQVLGNLKQQGQTLTPAASSTEAKTANGHSSPSSENAETPEDYTIVHSVPGRIRLRIPRLRTDAMYAKRLQGLLAEDTRVKSARINRAAASLAIQYDGSGVSELELGLTLLQVLEQADSPSPAASPA
ncbi:MAG: HMA2 domain-containing protein [Phormidium sp.]